MPPDDVCKMAYYGLLRAHHILIRLPVSYAYEFAQLQRPTVMLSDKWSAWMGQTNELILFLLR
jgi:hypothetical protein